MVLSPRLWIGQILPFPLWERWLEPKALDLEEKSKFDPLSLPRDLR